MSPGHGPARRALRMASMSAGISGSYLGYLAQSAFLGGEAKGKKLKATHTKAAKRMSADLIALRGPAMKLGQSLSLHTNLLSEETIAELSRLQMEAPGMHPSLVRAQFRTSMGKDPEAVYLSFDPEPFAAASLGQVHHARLKSGERVAVKIQYPGIRNAIENDFKWFRTVSKPAQLSRHVPASALDELQEQIIAECDYRREARNIAHFRDRLKGLPYVELPHVYAELSTDKVLTMSLVEGKHLDPFMTRRPSRRTRDLVGEHLVELFYFQILTMDALHADPHWGNYLFRDDGTIGLIDFGCVKYFRPEFVANMRKMFLYSGRRDTPEFHRILDERYAARGAKLSPAARAALTSMSENFYSRVYPPSVHDDATPFDFSDPAFLADYMREAGKVAAAKGALPDYVFLGRAESGLYQTLHRLRARVHTSAIVRKWL